MRRARISVLVAAVSLTLAAPANAIVESLAAGWTIRQGLQELEDGANSVVETAGAEAKGTVMEASQAALNAIGALRAAYADSLDKTFGQLTEAERAAFEDVRALIFDAEGAAGRTVQDIERVSEKALGTIQGLPLVKRIPLVTEVSPLHFVAGGEGDILVRARGWNLAAGDPHLLVGGRKVYPERETDDELQFRVARPILQVADAWRTAVESNLESLLAARDGDSLPDAATVPGWGGKPLRGQLIVYQSKTRWLLWSEYEPHTYSVALFPVPPILGAYRAFASLEKPVEERVSRRTGRYRCVSRHGRGSRTVPAQLAATEGWQIDPSSVRFDRGYANHGDWTLGSVSGVGFTAQLRCRGFGRREVAGVVVDHGSQGVIEGHFKYTEYRSTNQLALEAVGQGVLAWGEDVLLHNLPAGTTTVAVALLPFTGRLVVSQGTNGNRFFHLDYDRASQQAVLHGRDADEALRE